MAGRSINKVILIGNLGQDPEVRHTGSGIPVATFSLATNELYKDQDGKLQEKPQWHNIVAWRKTAEICGDYLKKGSRIYLEGKIQYRQYEDKAGVKRTITEIVADQIMMLDSKGSVSPELLDSSSPDLRNEKKNISPEPSDIASPDQQNEKNDDDLPF